MGIRMINRRTFLKLTAAASAALLDLKPKAKPERVVGMTSENEIGFQHHLKLTQEQLDDAFIEFPVHAKVTYTTVNCDCYPLGCRGCTVNPCPQVEHSDYIVIYD